MTVKHLKTENEARAFLEKVVINAGVGRASQQPGFEDKALVQIIKDLSMLCGQKPQIRRAKKSIAGFKSREGQIVGLRVTLRRQKMVDFFERLITIVLPRVRDFGGLDPNIVDKGGVLNAGFREQYVFPEIDPEESPFTFPLGVNIVPKEKDQKIALETFKKLGVPMREVSSEAKTKKRRTRKK